MAEYGSLREKIAAESKARKARYAEFEAVFNEANRAGFAAAEAMTPAAMAGQSLRLRAAELRQDAGWPRLLVHPLRTRCRLLGSRAQRHWR